MHTTKHRPRVMRLRSLLLLSAFQFFSCIKINSMSIKAKCQIVNGRRFNVSWRRCRCNQQATLKYSNLVGFISSITLEKGYDGVKTRDVPAIILQY
jgi:hypothetical protein